MKQWNVWRKRGVTMVEVLTVITIIGILAAISVPSFSGWFNKETYDRQVRLVFDSLNEARAGMLAEKNCPSGNPAEAWLLRLTDTDLGVFCRPVGGSAESVTFNDVDVNDYAFDTLLVLPSYQTYEATPFESATSPEPTALLVEFLIATKQIRINEDFANEAFRIQLDYLFSSGIETTICLNRHSQFAFFSPGGNCLEL